MKDKKVMSIVAQDGSIDEVEVILAFNFNDNNKKYVIYTKNETDANGNVTIYAATVSEDNAGGQTLGGIESDEEWAKVKDVLRELSKSDN